jgi:hypothetical protein
MTGKPKPPGPVLHGPVTDTEPEFLRDISTDRLVGAIVALAAELYIVKDRNALLENQLAATGAIDLEKLEAPPGQESSDERQAELNRYVQRILGELTGIRDISGEVDPAAAGFLDPYPE